jgi:hypothetical protein
MKSNQAKVEKNKMPQEEHSKRASPVVTRYLAGAKPCSGSLPDLTVELSVAVLLAS